jgi:hypothetical protein
VGGHEVQVGSSEHAALRDQNAGRIEHTGRASAGLPRRPRSGKAQRTLFA